MLNHINHKCAFQLVCRWVSILAHLQLTVALFGQVPTGNITPTRLCSNILCLCSVEGTPPIPSDTPVTPGTTPFTTQSETTEHAGLSVGVTVGVVSAVLLLMTLLINGIIICLVLMARRRKKNEVEPAVQGASKVFHQCVAKPSTLFYV